MNAMTENYLPAQMKASDSDRDAVVSDLGEHFQAGRLTDGEFDERTGRALAARTWGELGIFWPIFPPPSPRHGSPPRGPRAPGRGGRPGASRRLRSRCWPVSGLPSPCWSMWPTSGGVSSGSFFRRCW